MKSARPRAGPHGPVSHRRANFATFGNDRKLNTLSQFVPKESRDRLWEDEKPVKIRDSQIRFMAPEQADRGGGGGSGKRQADLSGGGGGGGGGYGGRV